MSAEPVGESTGEIRPLRISPELARELLRVLREEDLELPEDSTVLAVIVEPHHARRPAPPQRPLPSASTSTSTTTVDRRHRRALCGDGATRPQPRRLRQTAANRPRAAVARAGPG